MQLRLRRSLSAHRIASVLCAVCVVISMTTSPAALGQTSNTLPAPSSPGAPYDYYLLSLSWSPEFCATHADNEQCGHHLGFVVHGLWPENYDGSYPPAASCTMRPASTDHSLWAGIIPTDYLAQHEWQTHGICTPTIPKPTSASSAKPGRR
jgi:ribonuclease T2